MNSESEHRPAPDQLEAPAAPDAKEVAMSSVSELIAKSWLSQTAQRVLTTALKRQGAHLELPVEQQRFQLQSTQQEVRSGMSVRQREAWNKDKHWQKLHTGFVQGHSYPKQDLKSEQPFYDAGIYLEQMMTGQFTSDHPDRIQRREQEKAWEARHAPQREAWKEARQEKELATDLGLDKKAHAEMKGAIKRAGFQLETITRKDDGTLLYRGARPDGKQMTIEIRVTDSKQQPPSTQEAEVVNLEDLGAEE